MTTHAVPSRVFLPLADSPLMTGDHTADADLAAQLASTALPDPATIRALLSITSSPLAEQITQALDERDDLPPTALALLVAHRPDARRATAELRRRLFPDDADAACHRFAHTIAAIAHHPGAVDTAYLSSDRFRTAAAGADPAVLHELLTAAMQQGTLTDAAEDGLTALRQARIDRVPTAAVDLAITAALDRTDHDRIRRGLRGRREQTIRELAAHTGGLTLAAGLWFDTLTTAASTPAQADQARGLSEQAGNALATGAGLDCPWPAVRARWQHVTAAARPVSNADRWQKAWRAAEHTDDGAVWNPTQRALVAGYDLLAEHVHNRWGDSTVPTPQQCWAADPDGRSLLHLVADHFTGYHTHSPLPHHDDRLLIAFAHGLAKTRRDRISDDLHLSGLVAAIKAARSKTALLTRAAPADLGIVVPMRGETARFTADGRDPLTVKLAQLQWLLTARPDTRAEVLLVDEAGDAGSAHAATAAIAAPPHPQIRLSIAARGDDTSTKGGAVRWGLAELLGAGHTTLVYTDLDLTYPLDQLGLHLAALDECGTGAVIGSRRRPDSSGYYPPTGPNAVTRLYQSAVRDLLQLNVGDPQAGFKAFPAPVLRTALPLLTDTSLAFDTDLLAAVQGSGHTVTEVGIAALHRYVDGHHGTPRDYDAMLHAVHRQALRHGLDPEQRRTPVWDSICRAGSLTAAAASAPSPLPFPR